MVIDLKKVSELALLITQTCLTNNGDYIETDEDNFWFVDLEDGMNLTKEPSMMCVGSLEEDYKELSALLNQEREVSILDLDRLANMFRILSYEINKQKDKIM